MIDVSGSIVVFRVSTKKCESLLATVARSYANVTPTYRSLYLNTNSRNRKILRKLSIYRTNKPLSSFASSLYIQVLKVS